MSEIYLFFQFLYKLYYKLGLQRTYVSTYLYIGEEIDWCMGEGEWGRIDEAGGGGEGV